MSLGHAFVAFGILLFTTALLGAQARNDAVREWFEDTASRLRRVNREGAREEVFDSFTQLLTAIAGNPRHPSAYLLQVTRLTGGFTLLVVLLAAPFLWNSIVSPTTASKLFAFSVQILIAPILIFPGNFVMDSVVWATVIFAARGSRIRSSRIPLYAFKLFIALLSTASIYVELQLPLVLSRLVPGSRAHLDTHPLGVARCFIDVPFCGQAAIALIGTSLLPLITYSFAAALLRAAEYPKAYDLILNTIHKVKDHRVGPLAALGTVSFSFGWWLI